MSHLTITTVLGIFLVLLGARATATTMHTYNDCTITQRNYLEDRLEQAMVWVQEVVEAGGIPNNWAEPGQDVSDIPKEEMAHVARLHTANLNNPPALTFTCPKPGSKIGKYCSSASDEGSFDASEANWLRSEGNGSLSLCRSHDIDDSDRSGLEELNAKWILTSLIGEAVEQFDYHQALLRLKTHCLGLTYVKSELMM